MQGVHAENELTMCHMTCQSMWITLWKLGISDEICHVCRKTLWINDRATTKY